MNVLPWHNPARVALLEQALAERILVIDGAMGTMIQRHELRRSRLSRQRGSPTGCDGTHFSEGHTHGPAAAAPATSRATTTC